MERTISWVELTVVNDSFSPRPEGAGYRPVGIEDRNMCHEIVKYSEEQWANVHTNRIKGTWSLFKRSIIGTFSQDKP